MKGNLDVGSVSGGQTNQTLEFSQDNINTSMREQNSRDVEDRSAILDRLDSTPIVVAIS